MARMVYNPDTGETVFEGDVDELVRIAQALRSKTGNRSSPGQTRADAQGPVPGAISRLWDNDSAERLRTLLVPPAKQILDLIASAGPEGVSSKELADKIGKSLGGFMTVIQRALKRSEFRDLPKPFDSARKGFGRERQAVYLPTRDFRSAWTGRDSP